MDYNDRDETIIFKILKIKSYFNKISYYNKLTCLRIQNFDIKICYTMKSKVNYGKQETNIKSVRFNTATS